MEPQFYHSTIPEIHRNSNILWFSLILSPVLIACVLIPKLVNDPGFYEHQGIMTSTFMYIAMGVTLIAIGLSKVLVNRNIESSKAKGLKEKYVDFRSNIILNAAFHEGATLVCLVFMQVESNFYFLVLAVFNLIFLYTARPTLQKFRTWYKLSNEEKQELQSAFPNAIP